MAGKGVFVVGAKRTAFGTFGGKLKSISATDLGVFASQAALKHANVSAENIDHVISGNVVASSRDGIYLTRHIGLKAGVPQNVGALTEFPFVIYYMTSIVDMSTLFQKRHFSSQDPKDEYTVSYTLKELIESLEDSHKMFKKIDDNNTIRLHSLRAELQSEIRKIKIDMQITTGLLLLIMGVTVYVWISFITGSLVVVPTKNCEKEV